MIEKPCSKCGLLKRIDAFYPYAASRDGRRPDCRECVKERERSFYRANADRLRPVKRERMKRPPRPDLA